MLFGTTAYEDCGARWDLEFKKLDIDSLAKSKGVEISEQAKGLIAEMLHFSEKHRKTAH